MAEESKGTELTHYEEEAIRKFLAIEKDVRNCGLEITVEDDRNGCYNVVKLAFGRREGGELFKGIKKLFGEKHQ